MGGNKVPIIDQFPVLKWYHEQFKEYLSKPDTRLITIGYRFGDLHINQVIRDAAFSENLGIFIIDPLGVDVIAPVSQRLGFAGAGPRSDQQRRRPLLCLDTIGSSAALRRVQPLEKHVYGPSGAGSVLFLFHRNRITSRVRPPNPAKSRQAQAFVPAITDRGYGRLSARIVGWAPSTCQVGFAGCRRWQCALGIYDQAMLQISAQTWSVWVLEALCSAAVT
jgi:hypothetical protein